MKAFDWVLLVVSLLWVLVNGIQLASMLNSYEVRVRKAKVTVPSLTVLIPILIWLFIAYRVGG